MAGGKVDVIAVASETKEEVWKMIVWCALTFAWNVMPWKNACSACNGIRKSCSSRTKSYGVDGILK